MTVMTQAKLEVVPLTKHIGAEIRGLDLREKPDEATIKAIYQAWLDHIVIIFPDQKLSQEDLIRVTGYFGEQGMPRRPPKFFPKGYAKILPGIMLISNIRENGEPIGALPDGEMMFHHDMIHSEMPDKATLLYSVEIPSTGGNTLFASGYAAYETLDPAVRNRLEGRMAIHHYNYGSMQKGDGKGTEAFGAVQASGVPHPRGHQPQGGLRQPPDDGRRRRHAAGGGRAAAQCGVRSRREEGVRLRARLAARRPDALGQPQLVARAHRLPLDRAAADAAHDGARAPGGRTDGPPNAPRYAPSLRARSSRLGGDVDRHRRRRLAFARAMLVRACDVPGAQPALRRVREIVAVRRDHHAIAGRQIERLAGGEIDPRLGLEVAGDLGAEDRVPGKIVAAREIDHQRDIAVRHRREPELPLEPRQAGRHIRPGVEPMPGEIEVAHRVLGQARRC